MSKIKLTNGFGLSVTPAAAVMWCGLLSRGVWMPIVCAFVHELGHRLALHLTGTSVGRMKIDVLGADIHHGECRTYGAEIAVNTAGACANLLFSAVCLLIKKPELAATNLGLAVFNLIPARPFDGGKAIYALLCRTAGITQADKITNILNKSTAIIFGILSGWLLFYNIGGPLWLVTAAMAAVVFNA